MAETDANILADPGTVGRTYELAGPGVYMLHELVRMTLHLMSKRRILIPVLFAVAEIQARGCSRSCHTHHSPQAILIPRRRIMSRAGPFPVCKS